MTIDKDFKKIVRERMAKTGESYTAALRQLRGEGAEGASGPPEADGFLYAVEVDGRWSARDPSNPGHVGYGPTKRRACSAMLNDRFSALFKRRRANILTLTASTRGHWIARGTEDLSVAGEGTTERTATSALMSQLPALPYARWPEDRFTRTVWFEEHADGRWSARSDMSDGLMGWGKDRNEAEENLIQAEEDRDAMYDQPEDYGHYKDDF